MATQKAHGVTVTWNSATIGIIEDFDISGITASVIDMSHLSSTDVVGETTKISNVEKIASGLVDPGQVSFTVQYDHAVTGALMKSIGNVASLVITFTSGATFTVSAILVSISVRGSKGDKVSGTIQFELSGDITNT